MHDTVSALGRALKTSQLSQRALAQRTGISQATLSRIFTGERAPKMPELVLIADATGSTLAQLTGSAVADRAVVAARSTNGANMDGMRSQLLHFLEIDAYLDDYGITAP